MEVSAILFKCFNKHMTMFLHHEGELGVDPSLSYSNYMFIICCVKNA